MIMKSNSGKKNFFLLILGFYLLIINIWYGWKVRAIYIGIVSVHNLLNNKNGWERL